MGLDGNGWKLKVAVGQRHSWLVVGAFGCSVVVGLSMW